MATRIEKRKPLGVPATPLWLETLEDRLVPDAGLATFAHFAELNVAPKQPAVAEIHVRAADFAGPREQVILGFAVRGMDETVDAGSAAVLPAAGGTAQALVRRTDTAAGYDSLTLTRLGLGDFTVRWRAKRGTAGPTQLDVFLAGDANADFRVDVRDLDLIRQRFGTRQADARYLLDADVDRDGVIARPDFRIARKNLGAATTLRPPVITASLAPDSDPDGNGVVLRPTVTVIGQTQPGTVVGWATSSPPTTENAVMNVPVLVGREDLAHPTPTVVADANGRFQFDTELPPGLSTLRVEAIDGFGQSVTVERTVRYGDVILDWNASLLNVIRDWTTLSNDPYTNRVVTERPPVAARNLAMVHAAMFDAVNAIERTHEPYYVDRTAPDGASPVAAAASAAHRVASNLYRDTDELAVFDAALAEALATMPDGPAETLGVELGRQVADEILAWRSTDGATASVPYVPGSDPGDWNRTFPDYLPPLIPEWSNVTPFAMTSPSQFRPTPPPSLDSTEYAAAVSEVRELGGFGSTARTAEQAEIALFWADGGGTFTPPGHWNQIAADMSLAHDNTLAENARLFALLNIALADAGISAWDAKYAYDLWRPIDAIRRGDADGNELTTADPTWIPFLKTPPFPTYTSGHSTFSGAADAVLSSFFGSDTPFTSASDGHQGFTLRPLAERQIVIRSFASFQAADDEAGRSRIYGGIHFEFDNAAGLAAGRALGNFVIESLLRPRL